MVFYNKSAHNILVILGRLWWQRPNILGGDQMLCPFCSFPESRVLDSRPADEGNSIRRRRECGECGKRFTTYERVDERPLVVVKKDGRREVFDWA